MREHHLTMFAWGPVWKRAWQPIAVFLPGESQGQRSLVGYSAQGPTELDMTEAAKHACTHGVL